MAKQLYSMLIGSFSGVPEEYPRMDKQQSGYARLVMANNISIWF
jgi:hypothetical protein